MAKFKIEQKLRILKNMRIKYYYFKIEGSKLHIKQNKKTKIIHLSLLNFVKLITKNYLNRP